MLSTLAVELNSLSIHLNRFARRADAALAASAHSVPFYIAAPRSTIDFGCPSGAAIPAGDPC